MGYASRSGRARTNPNNPSAFAVCDRCGIWHNRNALAWQFDFRGPVAQNLRILVCRECTDGLAYQLKTIVLPADPLPVFQPRVEDFDAAITNYHTASGPAAIDSVTGLPIPGSTIFQTQDGQNISQQPIGIPGYIDLDPIMPQFESQFFGVALDLISVTADGTDLVSVTCRRAHGLATNGQVAVQGLSDTHACGAYSVTVTSAMAFTYRIIPAVPAGGLLTPSTKMLTANIGIPRGFAQIPQTGEWYRVAGGPTLPPTPIPPVVTTSFFLLETSGFILLEGGVGKLALEG